MSQFLYYLLLNTTYFAREDILLWQSKYIFSGKVSISSLASKYILSEKGIACHEMIALSGHGSTTAFQSLFLHK